MQLELGLDYKKFRWRDTDCYLLKADLDLFEVRPVMAKEQFPFRPAEQPVFDAIEQRALGCVAGCFNITMWNLSARGVTDQPQQSLVLDREIWTTGIGSGGYGFRTDPGWATTAKNSIQVVVWRPDGTTINVESINLRHSGKVVAFTPRGGDNDYPEPNKHYVLLNPSSEWLPDKMGLDSTHRRKMTAVLVDTYVRPTAPESVVLESKWPLKIAEGDVVTWVQRVGASTVVSGWPELLHNNENMVHGLLAVPSHGPDGWLVQKNPRTALGASADGKTAFLLTVQGRTPNAYRSEPNKGLRLKELGELIRQCGAAYAVNMDGGGSAYMWIRVGDSDHGGTLVAPGCYNKSGTLAAGRPAHFAMSVFRRFP